MATSQYHSKRVRLADEVLKGFEKYHPGERVPSVRDLAEQTGVSLVTMTRLLNDLVEHGRLIRGERGALFIPRKPKIGYLGDLPSPSGGEVLKQEALDALFSHVRNQDCEFVLLDFQEISSGHAVNKLSDLDGLLICGTHWDPHVQQALHDYKGKVMLMNQYAPVNNFPASRTVTDYIQALQDFFKVCDWDSYERIILVRAKHANAICTAQIFKENLKSSLARRIDEEIVLSTSHGAEMDAFRYFRKRKEEVWSKTLIVSLSGYYSQGIYTAFADALPNMPGLFSFDNLEARFPFDHMETPYFTAIERRMKDVFIAAFDALLQQINTPSNDQLTAIGIPAKLIIRRSVSIRPNNNIVQRKLSKQLENRK